MSAEFPVFVSFPRGTFHPVIDLSCLRAELAATTVPTCVRDRLTGPHDLHVLQELRAQQSIGDGDAVPVDYFVWGRGEPAHPAATKLGGVPYLPADVPWPERRGTTGDFYAQLNFLDSRDIVAGLPGDVLLIFRFHDLDATSWDEDLYEFLWVDVKDQDLLRPEHVRTSVNGSQPWPTLHGARARSVDVVVRERAAAGELDLRLLNPQVTKIGGVATDVQSVFSPEAPDGHRFIGQVTGVWPAYDVPYPAVDRAAPLAPGDPEAEAFVSGPGDGITCLYLDSALAVRVLFSCA